MLQSLRRWKRWKVSGWFITKRDWFVQTFHIKLFERGVILKFFAEEDCPFITKSVVWSMIWRVKSGYSGFSFLWFGNLQGLWFSVFCVSRASLPMFWCLQSECRCLLPSSMTEQNSFLGVNLLDSNSQRLEKSMLCSSLTLHSTLWHHHHQVCCLVIPKRSVKTVGENQNTKEWRCLKVIISPFKSSSVNFLFPSSPLERASTPSAPRAFSVWWNQGAFKELLLIVKNRGKRETSRPCSCVFVFRTSPSSCADCLSRLFTVGYQWSNVFLKRLGN